MKRLAVLGASGHGKVVADAAEASGWNEVSFFDDRWPELKVNGCWPVAGDTDLLLSQAQFFDGVVVAIGDNATRLRKMDLMEARGAKLISIVHPKGTVSSHSSIGPGTVIFAGAVINADASLGRGCIVNTCASVDHDCIIGCGVHISPGAHLAGGVSVGKCSWVGIGASVKQLVRIGSGVVVGAGAAVVSDIPDQCTVAGVPARALT